MNSSLIWNIRSVNTQQAFERVVLLHRQKLFNYVALLEPFQHVRHIDMYKLWLNMGTAWHNVNGKIWIFVDAEIQVEIMRDTEQLLSCRFTHLGDGQELVLTVVFASTDRSGRITLWEDLYDMSSHITIPWLVGGDFNVITDDSEKFGGLPVQFAETEDFRQCIDTCQLMDLGFTRSMFIWWNGRSDEAYPFFNFHNKLKKVGRALSKWSRDTYGDIFKKIATLEEVVQVHEQEFEQNPTGLNRERLQRVQTDLIRFYAIEEKFWRQKAGMQWFQDGDRSTKLFHAHVNGKRRKLQLQRIQDHTGTWLDTEEEIAQEAIRFFSDQFKEENIPTDFSMLDKIPKMVTAEQNQQLYEMPDEAKVKRAVFGLNGDSAGGPDGFIGRFFQACWEIIANELVNMVRSFFCGHELPRLIYLLPEIISPQQSGFVKGRSIVENILLAQEIVHDIRIRGNPANVIIKLDMAKAYDRVSWLFLTKVLRRMGFGEFTIDLVFRVISNNWYSILINGQPHGFFKSSRGVKQGDPLSPTLFILAAECLSRALNALHTEADYKEYGMPKWSPYSMPIHLLSACDPPSGVLAQIHRLFAKFFWSNSVGNSSKHWETWTTLCHPQEEGGMGFRSLQDISKALFAKLWWNMRTKQSLWRTFMSNKYLKKFHAVIALSGSGTYVWKKMIKHRDEMEHEIWWKLQQDFECDPTFILVKEIAEVGQWDEQLLRRILPEDLADHIVQHINPPNENDQADKAFWKLDSRGKFTVGSAFQLLRQRKDPSNLYKQMWIKGLPIKISFFMWRFWKFKLPLDDKLKKWGHQFPSRCYCCQHPEVEDTSHVFLHSPTAQAIWKYFCGPVGINIEYLQVTQIINRWWDMPSRLHVKCINQAIPAIIIWELWKRRNTMRHEGNVSITKLIYQRYSPKIRVTPVTWRTPDIGWIKVNTDGASRGNSGRSSWAFCVRDERGDVIQAQARETEDPQSTNTEAEALAILQALRYTI
ncbi:uncharacterized protein LOC132619785 [Lycium barbarum]|uniref:uncharacterized protein LOC132619785 n=1 Tax=Lycium barbarum TaxID=112863 RepID=UPI00293F006C|nr:uncharacterized protein LOC132619785 [Lycium barbarum]